MFCFGLRVFRIAVVSMETVLSTCLEVFPPVVTSPKTKKKGGSDIGMLLINVCLIERCGSHIVANENESLAFKMDVRVKQTIYVT